MTDKRGMKQKDMIYKIVREVLGNSYSSTEPMRPLFGPPKYKNTGFGETYETMKKAIALFKEACLKGEIELAPKYRNDQYIKNLFYNWLQKDKRLNGGKKKIINEHSDQEELVELLVNDPAIKNILLLYQHMDGANQEALNVVNKALFRFVVKRISEEEAKEIKKAA